MKIFKIESILFVLVSVISLEINAQTDPTGSWETSYGELYLYYPQNDRTVLMGEYFYTDLTGDHHGYLKGNLKGQELYLDWEEKDSQGIVIKKGTGYFKFSVNGSAFEGYWEQTGINFENSGKWNGSRFSEKVEIPDDIQPPSIANEVSNQINPKGSWKTDFGMLYLYYDANNAKIMTGEYSYEDASGKHLGTVEGDFDGKIFNLTWRETIEGGGFKKGTGYFEFSEDGKSFEGRWQQKAGNSGVWNGIKVSD